MSHLLTLETDRTDSSFWKRAEIFRQTMESLTEIRNGRVVTPTEVIEGGRVVISGSRIERVDVGTAPPLSRAETVDAAGSVVMPGLVDLHGDDVEAHRYPRSGAQVDLQMATATADRTNVLNGITTKFHAIAFEEDPSENRTIEDALELSRAIATAESTLGDNRVHARCELVEESVDAVETIAEGLDVDLVSLMHHAPGSGQYEGEPFVRHYVENRDCSPEGARQLAVKREARPKDALERHARSIVALADRLDIPVASHDDESPAQVDRMASIGATISEYPVTKAAARRATESRMVTAMGAPNLVRGGSLWDNLSARSAIEDDLVDVLCADYHPPSMLAAAFVDTGEPLPRRIERVTSNPAEAVGLADRGRLEEGARADVVVVDVDPVPTVECVYVAGVDVLRAG